MIASVFFLDTTNDIFGLFFYQTLLAAMAAVSLRVRCLQEPAWSLGRQVWEGMRSVWKET